MQYLRPEELLVERRVQQLGLDAQAGEQGLGLVEAVQQGGGRGLARAVVPAGAGRGGASDGERTKNKHGTVNL